MQDLGRIIIVHFFEVFSCVGYLFQVVHEAQTKFKGLLGVHKEEEIGDLTGFEGWLPIGNADKIFELEVRLAEKFSYFPLSRHFRQVEAVDWLRLHRFHDPTPFIVAIFVAKEILSLILAQLFDLVVNDDEVGPDQHFHAMVDLVIVEGIQH